MSKLLQQSLDAAGLTLGELKVGEEHRISHVDCPAGRDGKRRLYIKNLGTMVAWYCHNEGDGGVVGIPREAKFKHALFTGDIIKDAGYTRTVPVPIELECAPSYAGEYLKKYLGASWLELAKEHGIKWMPQVGLAYPMGEDGWNVRSFNVDAKQKYAKYEGTVQPTPLSRVYSDYWTLAPKLYVITEDYLSAVCIAKHLRCAGVPLHGVNVAFATLNNWVKTLPFDTTILVWLDNDSDLVKFKARGIVQDLSVLANGRKYYAWYGGTEPKKTSSTVRSDVLTSFMSQARIERGNGNAVGTTEPIE